MGLLGNIIPIIAERSIDEEGNLLGNQWLLTRLTGYGWANICYVIKDEADKSGLSLSDLGAGFGVGLNGVLKFPVPSRKLVQ